MSHRETSPSSSSAPQPWSLNATGAPRLRAWLLPAAALVAVTLLVYIPAMRGGFFWDDYNFLVHNPLIEAPDGLHRFWLTTEATEYLPLTYTMHWVEWRLWGDHPSGYHIVNVLLHAACAVLLWRVLRGLSVPGAWLAGLLFAVHPVAVASAGWIMELKNVLSICDLKEYSKAWSDVKMSEKLGARPEAAFLKALTQASGRTE